jgi:hypothetical protein
MMAEGIRGDHRAHLPSIPAGVCHPVLFPLHRHLMSWEFVSWYPLLPTGLRDPYKQDISFILCSCKAQG